MNNESKYIFLMRHGEDESINYKNFSHPSPFIPLCKKGIEEVVKSCKNISKYNFQIILHSPLVRAGQTAKIIQDTLMINESFCLNDLAEWRPPSSIYGVDQHSYKHEYINWRKQRHIDFSLQFEDGESLEELFVRTKRLNEELNQYYHKFDRILVVSHLVFMRALYCEYLSINHQNGLLYFHPDAIFDWDYCEMKLLKSK